MELTRAPFDHPSAEGPEAMQAYWITTEDDVRLRVALSPVEAGGARGTVLLFPGRTEYVEKYGRTAADLAARGYGMLTIDWRGQGLADRAVAERRAGHVGHFDEFQCDVRAMLACAEQLDLPRPWHLVGHSMGGCIGLRALMDRAPVASAAFTAPMWGIGLARPVRMVARAVTNLATSAGLGGRFVPSTGPSNYVLAGAFNDNTLTTDPGMWAYMRRQLEAVPDLELGGPTMQWLRAALRECDRLARMPAPDVPALTFLGLNERIVCAEAIRTRMAGWPNGTLHEVPGKEHELLMEDPATRARVIDQLVAHFDAAAGLAPAPLSPAA